MTQHPALLSTNRRNFLRAIGGTAASLPFIGMLADSVAQAAGETLPLRFIGVYHPHGVAAEFWAMREGESESNFDLSYQDCSLSPLDNAAQYGKSFKDKILIIEGLELASSANGHETAATILTGSRVAGKPSNISIDQYLAIDKGLGSSTRLATAALAVGEEGSEPGTTLSYGPGGAPLPKIIDPVKAFDLFFAGFVVGDDPEAEQKAARQRALGKSLIDFVKADINRLHPRLAAREQQKLDQHLTSLRELEKQFEAPVIGANCVVPGAPSAAEFPSVKRYNGGEPYFPAISDFMIDVMAQAMACDITRFGTLYLNDVSFEGNPLGLPADNHGNVAHTYNASPIGNDGRPGEGVPSTWLPLAKINHYSYGQIARLLQRLDEYGVLDSTLVYASSDMGNPSLHSTRNVPTLLAGGANGKFRMGRRLRMPADCPTTSPWCGPGEAGYAGVTNNHLLVSILQAFGVEEDEFGTQPDAADRTGALDGLV
jgi:hypothetical protein